MNPYCAHVQQLQTKDPLHVHCVYHDKHYGFPISDDNELFGRLIMEINQAGLSWETILKKEQHFRDAYAQFDIQKVAAFTEEDRTRLLANAGIIRNKLKVNAAIHNANIILQIQQQYGSFLQWIEQHHPLTKDQWVKLFKKHFKFVGGEIVNEFLMSIGILPGAHSQDCPIYASVESVKQGRSES